jgi:DNA repair protein RecO (recombination protein O)
MPNVSAQIIVLKKTKLSEMDLIVTGFSSEGHQVRTVVKGGRKPGSRRGAHLELFSKSQVLLYIGRSSLSTVSEAELVNSHSECRRDIEHTTAAAAITELVETISRDADVEPRLFLLLDACLDAVGGTDIDGLNLITAASLLKIVGQIGFLPNLESCSICGRPRGSELSMRFSFSEGGLICPNCLATQSGSDEEQAEGSECAGAYFGIDGGLSPENNVTAVEPELFDWLVLLIRSRFDDLAQYAVTENRAIGRVLLVFARDWIRAHVAQRNRSVDFLLNMR